jgi:methylated-DNA-[protein]-cysteine S-methyltransferase
MDFAALSTPVGTLEIAVDGDTLVSLEFVDSSDLPRPAASPVVERLEAYFGGDLDALATIPVRFDVGTPFQRDVWTALTEIPLGEAISYADLAQRVGRPQAFRAVGSANGKNPIAVVVPCHRVIAADGTLGGYGGGLERKRWLLAHEGVTGIRDADRQGMLC